MLYFGKIALSAYPVNSALWRIIPRNFPDGRNVAHHFSPPPIVLPDETSEAVTCLVQMTNPFSIIQARNIE